MDPSFSERGMFEELELLAKTPEMRRAWDRVRTAAIRGAAAGVLIKGGLHTLTFVMYLLSRIRGKGRQRVTTLADVLRDTVLHTCFLAALGSSYTAMDEGIALVFGKASTQRWRALLAGLIAGQSLRMTGSHRRHYSLATYILLRGLTLLVRTGNKPSAPPALRALLRPTRLQNGDTLLMCVAASQILYSFIMAPSTLPPTYVRFITRMGGKDPAVWAAIREHAMRNSLGLAPGPLRALTGTPLAYLNSRPGRIRTTPCEFFHPGQSCAGHAVSVLPQAYGTSLAVYVPFYLVSSVLVHRTALLARPRELLPKMAVAVLRSSAFLSAYIAAAFAGACGGFCVTGTNTGGVIAGSVWAGGLATLLEKKSRRMELAMYCAARALEAFIRCCWLWRADVSGRSGGGGPPPLPPGAAALAPPRQWRPAAGAGGAFPRPRASTFPSGSGSASAATAASGGGGLRLDVLLFSLGCGAIMHCYSDSCGQHRDVFRSKYLNVLDFIFGNEGVQQGSISHVPTNLELVSSVSRRLRTMSRGVLSSASGDYGLNGSLSLGQSTSTFAPSPLPRSTAHSQADSLGLTSPAAGGHIHHGGHGYSRYLALQQQRHQQHRELLQQLGTGGSSSSDAGLGERGASPQRQRQQQGRLRSSQSSGAAAGPTERGAASSPASVSGRPPLPPSPVGAVSPVQSYKSGEAAAAVAAATGCLQLGEAAAVVGAVAKVAEAITSTPGRSGGGSSSQSSSEWEDVWAATTGSSPNAGVASKAAEAEAGSRAASREAPKVAEAEVAGTDYDAGSMPRISSAPMVGHGAVVRRSPFAASPTRGPSPAVEATPAPGALGWAARLVAGAFHRAAPASAGGASPSASDGAAGPGSEATAPTRRGRIASAVAAAATGSTEESPLPTISSEAGERGSLWAFGRRSSMRRISTAPHGLQHSARALLLLSDPASEHCGHGRSSYKELQRLSSSGDVAAAMAAATAAAAADAAAGGGDEDVSSPASTSSTSLEAAAAAAALFSAPASPLCVGSSPQGSAPASPPGRRATPPSRARPVPVPNATSRTPAFRPRGPIIGAGAAGPPPSRKPCGNSLGSNLNHLPGSSAGIHGSHANSSGSCNDINSSRVGNAPCRSGGGAATAAAGGSNAVTFELHGALSHPSPVPRAAVWPRMSYDAQGGGGGSGPAVCRSAPEVRESALSAALAAAVAAAVAQDEAETEAEEATLRGRRSLEAEVEAAAVAVAMEEGAKAELRSG